MLSPARTVGPGSTEGSFTERVRAVVRALPPGQVVTYGEVAREAGSPGAARAVGRVLAAGGGLPWWRVVTADGRLVPGNEDEHGRRLRAEGVVLRDGRVVMSPPDGTSVW